MTDATELDEAAVRRDAQVVREHIPSGYHVAHRVADAVPLLLDEITRLRAALDDLHSRLACVLEASYWDRGYDVRMAAIRGMCDLATDGMTPKED